MTVVGETPDTQYHNESLPKLWQLPTDGLRMERVSCDRGEQSDPAAGAGRQVVGLDATTGSTDLAIRDRPAGMCCPKGSADAENGRGQRQLPPAPPFRWS
ncbi:hypothetical protein ACIOMM_36225 [Streptomyces sp. NPDC087908]|uniref:hypothetical protein n=1 Tax=Streptomyces sp. NPDC087908 TaxID=3365820 RepID=UPI0037F3F984